MEKPATNRQHEITLELTHKFFKARTDYLTCQGLTASKQKALSSALNKAHKALDSKIHKLWCDAFDAPGTED